MNKILLIIRREYMTRVRKKSFIIMTILGPLLMASAFVVPLLINKATDDTVVIEVVDEVGINLKNSDKVTYVYRNIPFSDAKESFSTESYYAILYIPMIVVNNPEAVVLYAGKEVSLLVKDRIAAAIEQQLYDAKLADHGIDRKVLESLRAKVKIKTLIANGKGVEKKSSSEIATVAAMVSAFLIYLFIFLYGSQVMRGVIEEKTGRIIEVIISSVKPFQLMMGKILGVAMVGLTQFLLWIILTAGITFAATAVFVHKEDIEKMGQQGAPPGARMNTFMAQASANTSSSDADELGLNETLALINFPLMLSMFAFYFLGGYLLYSALFAAVGSAVDSETDTQQFMVPITVPLILAITVAQSSVISNPGSAVAFWFSIIPLTSPIVMMVRIPFGVPIWEIVLSMTMLVAGFIFTTWLAGRIYRTGILMYGKKVNYRELMKWLFYKG